jgi:Integrase core domain
VPRTLLHMDVKKFGKFTQPGHRTTGDRTRTSRRTGWEYVHSIIDDCPRVAHSAIHDDEQAPTVAAFTHRALDWFLELGICSERLMRPTTPGPSATTARCASCCAPARSSISAPAPTHRAPTGRSSATSRRCNASGPTRWNTPPATPVASRCHTGSLTTTSDAPTVRWATDPPLHRVREVSGLNN